MRILGEAEGLQELGHSVKIVTYHLGKDPEGVETHRIINIPWYKKLEAGPSMHKIYLDMLLLIKSIAIAAKFKPDIIHSHLHEGALLGKVVCLFFRKPLVFDYQGSLAEESVEHGFFKRGSLVHKVFIATENFINLLPHYTIASTKPKGKFKKMRIIPDGVNVEFYAKSDKEKKIPSSVIYLGLLNEYQGIDILLQAAKKVHQKLPQAQFIIGGFPNVEYYKKKAKDLGVDKYVSFPGKIPYAQSPSFLKQGTIAVAPKLSSSEANLKIPNFMACGLPVVCFDTLLNRQYLGEKGLYASMGDIDNLAEKIISLLKFSEKESEKIGALLKQKVEAEFSWKTIANNIETVYKEIS